MKLKALKVRIYPNASQEQLLAKTFGCCRFLYNQMLDEHIKTYETLKDNKKALKSHKYKTEKEYKQEHDFMYEVDSTALQQSRIDLHHAFLNFFRRLKDPKIPLDQKGFPKFKAKHAKNSFRSQFNNNNIKINFERKKLQLPKLGWISFRDPRTIENIHIHSVTTSKTSSGKYYASILYTDESKPRTKKISKAKSLKVKGLDMSLTNFFVDDEGNSPQYDAAYRNAERKIAKLDSMIASTKKKSLKNKLRLRRARMFEYTANKRKDFIEKLSRTLVEENDVIVVEDLSLKDMAKFRTWEERKNDKRDKNNHGKTVNDLGWGMFLKRLKTKALELGVVVIEADRWFASTQICSKCGYQNKDMTIKTRSWVCPNCGVEHMRDQNAAQNIKQYGLDEIFTAGTADRAAARRNGNHLQ